MTLLRIAQTPSSPIPSDGKCEPVQDEEEHATQQQVGGRESDSSHPHDATQKHNKRGHGSEEAGHLQENDRVHIFVFRRAQKDRWPPTPIHVGEGVHQVFEPLHTLELSAAKRSG